MARIHVPKKGTFTCGPSSTAEEAVEYLRQVLDEPAHGNVLLSCGPQKLDPTQQLREFNADFVFANYSWLSSGPPIHIAATELRGITIEQLSSLLDFIVDIASSWCDAHHLAYGQPLSFEAFNLYHTNFWVIGPATAGHNGGGCSYVELVATSAQMQRPLWFVSHAWLEPVCNFVACLKRHASLRQLSEQTAYWVCAYANNQHQLEAEICHNPRKTSFYRAIKMCAGVLLVLDNNATPFTRIWCCFEQSIAVEERNKGSPLLLDVAATEQGCAHVITDGLVGEERKMMPLLGFLAKSRREAEFPTEVLLKGLDVDIASAMASKEADKKKILNSIALPRARTKILQQEAHATHESYAAVGRALAGHCALANLFCSVANGLGTSRLLTALRSDAQRHTVQLSLTGCCKFDDLQLSTFLAHLPAHLQILRLDLGFTAVQRVEFPQMSELQELSLRITKTPLRQVNLPTSSMPKLRSLQLLLSNLPDLEELQLEVARSSWRQSSRELVVHVYCCPKLTRAAKQALHDSLQTTWPWHRADRWISIEETQKKDVFSSSAVDPVTFSSAASCPEMSEEDKDMPFPCGEKSCKELHQNHHGYCDKHRLFRFWRMASSGIMRTCVWLELIFLLSGQAAAEIQSRILLLIILLSLLPASFIFLEESTGMSVTFICITLLVVIVGSCFYTAKRLDRMQQKIFKLALATEASYFEVLQATEDKSQPLISVSSILGSASHGFSQELPRNDLDLTMSFKQARSSMRRFQRSVCDPLASLGSEVVAKIKPRAETDERGGDVDILFCEVVCNGLQRVQHAWHMLKDMGDLEIVAARDFFAVASSRKCCQVVVSVEGYLATVFLLEKSLSFKVPQQGISEVANSLGLLDRTKAGSWDVSRIQEGHSEVPRFVLLATALMRLVACFFSFAAAVAIHLESSIKDGFVHVETLWSFWQPCYTAMTLPWWTCGMILLWELRCGCCCFQCWKHRRRFRLRPRPTEVFYQTYFGVQGRHYAFKVAALQVVTVLIQAVAKANMFGAIMDALGAGALHSHTAFRVFLALLLSNILFPAFVFSFPNCVFSRVGAAVMDAVLDLGYLITSLAFYIDFVGLPALGDAFLHNFWAYMSMPCAAHVLCVCRSLETADWVALFQVPAAPPIWGVWKRVLFSIAYACGLFAVVAMLLGDTVLASLLEGGLCPPCECSIVASGSVALKRCIIEQHQSHGLSLRSRYFHVHAPTIDLRDKQLAALAPGAFRSQDAGKHMSPYLEANEIHLEWNRLTTLPAGAFGGVHVERLLLQNNVLTHLNAGSFRGLSFCSLWKYSDGYPMSELDLSHNKLRTLPPKIFDVGENYSSERHFRSDLHVLNLAHNEISSLPADAFAGHSELGLLASLQKLNLSQNALKELPSGLFDSLSGLEVLDLSYNQLSNLDSRLFNLSRLSTLDLRGNPLTRAAQLDMLDLADRRVAKLRMD